MIETESDFLGWVMDLGHSFGWQLAHFRPARTKDGGWVTAVAGDAVGFPDIIMVGPQLREGNRRLLVVEAKSDKGRPSPQQVVWLDLFNQLEGTETYLVRPLDREEFQEIIMLSHVPNLIERASWQCSWINRRETY